MFANTGILQILAKATHSNTVGLTKQNKPELALRTQNCMESMVAFPEVEADSLDKRYTCFRPYELIYGFYECFTPVHMIKHTRYPTWCGNLIQTLLF